MMEKVDEAIERLLGREGGYVDHPDDPGGATRWGITERVARAFGYDGPMAELPRVRAKAIYLSRYWLQPGFDRVAHRHPQLAEELFDTGVNQGTARASMYLQRGLNIFNRRGRDFPDIEVDGRIGALTLAALDALIQRRGRAKAERLLARVCNALQIARYVDIIEARESLEEFAAGWIEHRGEMTL